MQIQSIKKTNEVILGVLSKHEIITDCQKKMYLYQNSNGTYLLDYGYHDNAGVILEALDFDDALYRVKSILLMVSHFIKMELANQPLPGRA